MELMPQFAIFGALTTYGFLGSLHCAGMCGPIVMMTRERFSWNYFLSRAFSYGAIGFLCGLFGSLLDERTLWQGSNLIGISVAILILAIMVYELYRYMFRHKASKFNGYGNRFLQKAMQTLPLPKSMILGLFTPLLPCGFLYGAILQATLLGHPVLSATGMVIFSVATAPALFLGKGVMRKVQQMFPKAFLPLRIVLLSSVLITSLWRAGILNTGSAQNSDGLPCHTEGEVK